MGHDALPALLPRTHPRDSARSLGWGKLRLLCCGPTIRRQSNTRTPAEFGLVFETVRFPGARGLEIEVWRVRGNPGAPVVLLFPGHGASKDTLMDAGSEFARFGCELLRMVDPDPGVGGSAGAVTSVAFHRS